MAITELGFDPTRVYTALQTTAVMDVDMIPPALGTIYEDSAGNAHRFVKNNHSAALTIGDVVFLDKTADYPNAVSELNTDSCGAVAAGVMAGVARGPIPAAGYGWIQYAGVGSANCEGTTDIVVGDSLKGVNSQLYAVKDAALAAVASYTNHLRALKAYTTNSAAVTAGIVSINCRNY